MVRKLIAGMALAAALGGTASVAGAARAAAGEVVAHRKGFTNLTIVEGLGARLVQTDPIWDHGIESLAKDGRGRPLFSSRGTLGAGRVGWIHGVTRLEPGVYAFRDPVYTWWRGTITVVSAGERIP